MYDLIYSMAECVKAWWTCMFSTKFDRVACVVSGVEGPRKTRGLLGT